MSAGVSVRAAVPGDVAGIARVCADGYRVTYRDLLGPDAVERVIEEFYDPRRIAGEVDPAPPHWLGYVVADEAGTVVGAAGGAVPGDGVGELYVLYLDPARRGEGIGTRLLAHVTGQVLAHGAREMWVSVTEGNDLGIPFYAARGFVVHDRRPAHGPAGDGPPSLRMRRPITAADGP